MGGLPYLCFERPIGQDILSVVNMFCSSLSQVYTSVPPTTAVPKSSQDQQSASAMAVTKSVMKIWELKLDIFMFPLLLCKVGQREQGILPTFFRAPQGPLGEIDSKVFDDKIQAAGLELIVPTNFLRIPGMRDMTVLKA